MKSFVIIVLCALVLTPFMKEVEAFGLNDALKIGSGIASDAMKKQKEEERKQQEKKTKSLKIRKYMQIQFYAITKI